MIIEWTLHPDQRKLPNSRNCHHLQYTRLDDRWLLVVVDLSASASSSLKSLDNHQRGLISDLTEDDVLAIEPAGNDGGNEELGAVAVEMKSVFVVLFEGTVPCLRVWSGVGHGQKSWLGVLAGEVLIGELLTVDGLSTSALCMRKLPV